jgi:hypothetical protein
MLPPLPETKIVTIEHGERGWAPNGPDISAQGGAGGDRRHPGLCGIRYSSPERALYLGRNSHCRDIYRLQDIDYSVPFVMIEPRIRKPFQQLKQSFFPIKFILHSRGRSYPAPLVNYPMALHRI